MNNKVVIFSFHYYNSKNKAGFHNIANAFKNCGFDVHFITTPVSIFSFLKRDPRIFNNGFIKNVFNSKTINSVHSYINFNLFHPVNRNNILFEKILLKFYNLNKRYYDIIKDADYIIFESSTALFFIDNVKLINPDAKLIYRMSDDVEEMNLPNMLKEKHKEFMKDFNLISIPSFYMWQKYKKIYPDLNIKLHYHGIEKTIFDECLTNPYQSDCKNAVFVGMSHFDQRFIEVASNIFDNIIFHIIGNINSKLKAKNVKYYGILSFKDTIGYIKYADIGLAILKDENKQLVKTLDSTLKVIQYTYCKLPIILPSLIETEQKNFFKYIYDDEYSIRLAIENALKFDKKSFMPDKILTWEELALELIND